MGKNEDLIKAIKDIRVDAISTRTADVRKVFHMLDMADPNGAVDGMRANHLAADGDHLDVMKALKASGADLDAAASNGKMAIHFAARTAALNCIMYLKHQVDAIDQQGQTPLHIAAVMGHKSVIDLLASLGADTQIKNKLGETPRDSTEDPEIQKFFDDIEKLREEEARKREADRLAEIERRREEDRLAELEAKAEEERRKDQERRDKEEAERQAELARLAEEDRRLREAAPKDSVRPKSTQIASDKIQKFGSSEVSKYRLPHRKEPKQKEPKDPGGHKTDLEFPLPLDPNDPNELLSLQILVIIVGQGPSLGELIEATKAGNFDEVERMLKNPYVTVVEVDAMGNTALVWGAVKGFTSIARQLIEKGADVNHENKLMDTPITWSVNNGQTETTRLLLACGANANHHTKKGCSPLTLAAAGRHTEIARLLIENGADVNYQNANGSSPLILAASWGKSETARVLLAQPKIKTRLADKDGEVAESAARRWGHHDIALLIREQEGAVWVPVPVKAIQAA
ncbi:unnamed protein product [Meganyctiphanes norvegica]|uniref:Ankyrin repeat domain-containing protein n=1 Tax=Meganyctiphanes norvegica TaxID=48144 RepID=A0AAV2QHS4_MEGNR